MITIWLDKLFGPDALGYWLYSVIIIIITVLLLIAQIKKGLEDWRNAKTFWAAIEEFGMCILILAVVYLIAQIGPIDIFSGIGTILSGMWNSMLYPLIKMVFRVG